MTKDLTVSNPFGVIIRFAVPVLCGCLFQQFYNLTDTFLTGRFIGVTALAQVGASGGLNFFINGFCTGLCAGLSIPAAQAFGGKDFKRMRSFVFNGGVTGAVIAFLLTLSAVFACRPLLVLFNTPHEIIDGTYSYFVIILCGIPAVILYNFLTGILRAAGDSRTPLYFLIFSACLNIFLDFVFIVLFKLGVRGAAFATVISQSVSGILCLVYIYTRYEIFRLKKEDCLLSGKQLRILCTTALPMGLQYSITAAGTIILGAAVNSLGAVYVASMSVASKLSMFFASPFDALGITMASYSAQNTGAGKIERLDRGLLCASLTGAVYSVMAFLVMLYGTDFFASLFMNGTESAGDILLIKQNVRYFLLANTSTYTLLALVNIVRFMIQGMGFAKLALFAGFFELAGRSFSGLLLVPLFGFKGACAASPLAWILADVFLVCAYLYSRSRIYKIAVK
jgi:putative MATE family efflux protein